MSYLDEPVNLKDNKHFLTVGFTLFLLITIPLTAFLVLNYRDLRGKAATTPNDPQFPNQWDMTKINTQGAWNIPTGAINVKVALLGTGVTPFSVDLQGGQVGVGINEVTQGGSTNDDFGTYGDGTAMAGIVGAKGNNGADIAGMNWNVTILPVKTCDLTGYCPNTALAAGINWAATNSAQIVLISTAEDSSKATPDVTAAVANAVAQGIIVIAPSGNYSGYVAYPANLPGVIAVGATDQNDNIASFSGQGSQLSLVAPGLSVLSLAKQGCCVYFTGGEFAAAHVAGAASLLLAQGIPAASVKNDLTAGVFHLGSNGFNTTYGYGRLDVCGAFQAAHIVCIVSLPSLSTATFSATPIGTSYNCADPTTPAIYCSVLATNGNKDTDGDGFTDAIEEYIGTNPYLACGINAWPPDFNNDGAVNGADYQMLAAHMGSKIGDANYSARYDLNADGKIDVNDYNLWKNYNGKKCSK